MYFLDDEHYENYRWLTKLYSVQEGRGGEYEANIYIAAVPDIFKSYNKERIDISYGPLVGLIYDEHAREGGHNRGSLTNSSWELIKYGMSLYNSYNISLDETFAYITDEDLIKVCVQGIYIRTKLC
ncbi:hypothetical protein [Alkalihalobacterium chitinilyticum]|uniref:Bacterial toxin 44 domain-containing protein n=1 Tax=Alkalihalobacterium chitinilyticum TaxID=2980103 RepID=A0ABT5VH20_9BACI|nr:hypothetical protein [Alkalihalobacterium chitinilyticum]MDE5414570.1 hypothetical protein [Alkalihalobacterium chitinilyticum]